MRTARMRLALAALLVWCWMPDCCAEELQNLDRDEWWGVYMAGVKVGYGHASITRGKLEGQDVYQVQNIGTLRMSLGEAKLEIDLRWRDYLDSRFNPLLGTWTRSIKGSDEDRSQEARQVGEVRYGTDALECRFESDGEVTEKKIPIPAGVAFRDYYMYSMGAKKLSPGQSVEVASFDREDLAIEQSTMKALRREKVEVKGVAYDALVVQDSSEESATSWWLDNGALVKREDRATGLMVYRETREEALKGLKEGGAAWPLPLTDRRIPDARNVTELKVRLVGFWNEKLVVTDARQSATFSAERMTVDYHIVAKRFDGSRSVQLPIEGDEYSKWLGEGPGIETNDKAIQAQAREIVGEERSAFRAASKLREWVYENVEYACRVETDTETLPSAAEVLMRKAGVCADMAVLYVALARAAGIPTRFVAGLTYHETEEVGGAFRLHAWAESFVGEWVPVDPSLTSDFVDATYIKLIEDKVIAGVPPIASGAKVIEYRHLGRRTKDPECNVNIVIQCKDGYVVKVPLCEWKKNRNEDYWCGEDTAPDPQEPTVLDCPPDHVGVPCLNRPDRPYVCVPVEAYMADPGRDWCSPKPEPEPPKCD